MYVHLTKFFKLLISLRIRTFCKCLSKLPQKKQLKLYIRPNQVNQATKDASGHDYKNHAIEINLLIHGMSVHGVQDVKKFKNGNDII